MPFILRATTNRVAPSDANQEAAGPQNLTAGHPDVGAPPKKTLPILERLPSYRHDLSAEGASRLAVASRRQVEMAKLTGHPNIKAGSRITESQGEMLEREYRNVVKTMKNLAILYELIDGPVSQPQIQAINQQEQILQELQSNKEDNHSRLNGNGYYPDYPNDVSEVFEDLLNTAQASQGVQFDKSAQRVLWAVSADSTFQAGARSRFGAMANNIWKPGAEMNALRNQIAQLNENVESQSRDKNENLFYKILSTSPAYQYIARLEAGDLKSTHLHRAAARLNRLIQKHGGAVNLEAISDCFKQIKAHLSDAADKYEQALVKARRNGGEPTPESLKDLRTALNAEMKDYVRSQLKALKKTAVLAAPVQPAVKPSFRDSTQRMLATLQTQVQEFAEQVKHITGLKELTATQQPAREPVAPPMLPMLGVDGLWYLQEQQARH